MKTKTGSAIPAAKSEKTETTTPPPAQSPVAQTSAALMEDDLADLRKRLDLEPTPEATPKATEETTEEETEATPKATEEETEATEEETEEKTEEEADSLPADVQATIDKRIGKEVAKRKTAEERLVVEQDAAKSLREKLEAMESELAELKTTPTPGVDPTNASMMADSEEELEKRSDYLRQVTRFCDEFLDEDAHPNGYEGDGTEKNPCYSRQELKRRLAEVRDEREWVLPKARELLKRRQSFADTVKAEYPDLATKHSESAMEAQQILRAVPGLKLRPDYMLLIGDMIAGRKAREAKTKSAKTQPKPALKFAHPTPAKGDTPAPRLAPKITQKDRMAIAAEGGFSDSALAAAFE